MPSITIKVSADGAKWRADNLSGSRLVNGNSDYTLRLSFIGDGWSGISTTEITAVAEDGEAETLTRTGTNIALPAMHDKTMLRVNVTRGNRQTTTPAIIFCDACATDNAGTTDTPKPDIYNLMMELIHQKEIGAEEAASAILAQLTALRENAPPAFPGGAYRLATARSDRVTRITGTITQKNGTTQEITDDDILADSLSIETDAVANEALMPGGAPSAELRVGFRERITPESIGGAEIELTYHIQRHDEIWCDIPLGAFTVASDEKTEQGVHVVAYDDMKKLESIPTAQVLYNRYGSNTVRQILLLISQASGIPWDGILPPEQSRSSAYLPSFAVGKAGNAVETAWDLLAWAMQTVNCVAVIGKDRVLHIREISREDPVAEYSFHEFTKYDLSKTAYRLARIEGSLSLTDDVDGGSAAVRYSIESRWPTGVTATLDENPLWNGVQNQERIPTKQSEAGIYIAIIAELLSAVVYRPGEVCIHGDPAIEPLDWITIRLPDGSVEYPVTRSVWQYRGDHTLTACGAEAIAGVAKTQASKRALSERERTASNWTYLQRSLAKSMMRADGHRGLSGFTHEWLASFKHNEMGGG